MSSEINLEMGNSDNKQNPEKAPEKKHTVLKFLFVFFSLGNNPILSPSLSF